MSIGVVRRWCLHNYRIFIFVAATAARHYQTVKAITPDLVRTYLSANCQGEVAVLRQEEVLIDDTRAALQSYSAALRDKGDSRGSSYPSQHPDVSPSSEQPTVSLPVPPATEELKAKTETPPEPAMPAETPPLPPHAMVAQPHDMEDPFAEVPNETPATREAEVPIEQSSDESGGASSSSAHTEAEPAEKTMPQPDNEDKLQDGFDAFPPVDGFDNGSDPFAVTDFGGNGLGDVAVDDPFSASDAVFTNATAATSDGFDAFPPSTGAHFDAFGQ